MSIRFEWDPKKAISNLKKHGVGFGEAATVFSDTLSITISDPDHSFLEERFLTIGRSIAGRLLVVAHSDRGECTRIISAREPTKGERRHYEEG